MSGAVEDGSAGGGFASDFGDEAPVHELADGVRAVYAADGLDFGGGDGLAVGDDGEDFHEAAPEAGALGFEEAANVVGEFGFGAELVAAGDTDQLEGATGG